MREKKDRQTEKQTDKQTEKQTDRQTDRQREIQREREKICTKIKVTEKFVMNYGFKCYHETYLKTSKMNWFANQLVLQDSLVKRDL